MYLKPSQNFYLYAFCVSPTTSAPANADSAPTAALLRNGAVDGAVTLTITNPATGTYKIAGTVPSGYVLGDFCQVQFSATVGSVAGVSVPDAGTWLIETAYTSDPVGLKTGAVTMASLSADFAALHSRAYLISTGTTTPATVDQWSVGGLYNSTPFYVGKNTTLFAWYNGSAWIISSVLGTNGSAYFTGGANVTSGYTASGTASGTPVMVAHGNAVLSTFQPDVMLPATDANGKVLLQSVQTFNNTAQTTNLPTNVVQWGGTNVGGMPNSGVVTLASGQVVASVTGAIGSISGVSLPATVPSLAQIQAGLPTDSSIATDVQTGLTAQGVTTVRAAKLDALDANVSSRSTFAGGPVASVTGNVGGNVVGDIQGKVLGGGASSFVANGCQVSATVSGNVTVGGYATNQSPREQVLGSSSATALSTDTNGKVLLQTSQPGVTIPTVTTLTNSVSATVSGNVTVGGYAANQDPVTLLKGDSDFKALIANTNGQFTFTVPSSYPGNGTLSLKDKLGTTTLLTITLAYDTNKNIISRTVA